MQVRAIGFFLNVDTSETFTNSLDLTIVGPVHRNKTSIKKALCRHASLTEDNLDTVLVLQSNGSDRAPVVIAHWRD